MYLPAAESNFSVYCIKNIKMTIEVDPVITPANKCKVPLLYMELFYIDFIFPSFFKNCPWIASLNAIQILKKVEKHFFAGSHLLFASR